MLKITFSAPCQTAVRYFVDSCPSHNLDAIRRTRHVMLHNNCTDVDIVDVVDVSAQF